MIDKGRETAFGQFGQRSVEFLLLGVFSIEFLCMEGPDRTLSCLIPSALARH